MGPGLAELATSTRAENTVKAARACNSLSLAGMRCGGVLCLCRKYDGDRDRELRA